ncbi:MAG: DUF4170 domain-containing protein [Rhodospirillales bacterium]|nr:DUF4170 domain-containing protein [Rhodospirillales bacterium]
MSQSLLHLVFGGRVADPRGIDFVDVDALNVVGIFPNYATALSAWRSASQARVDEADWEYAIVHLHDLLDRDDKKKKAPLAKNKKKK